MSPRTREQIRYLQQPGFPFLACAPMAAMRPEHYGQLPGAAIQSNWITAVIKIGERVWAFRTSTQRAHFIRSVPAAVTIRQLEDVL